MCTRIIWKILFDFSGYVFGGRKLNLFGTYGKLKKLVVVYKIIEKKQNKSRKKQNSIRENNF